MTIRHDAVLLSALAAELGELVNGAEVGWVTFDAAIRTARLVTRNRPSILFRLDPREGYVLNEDDPGPRPPRAELAGWQNLEVGSVTVPPDVRRLVIDLVAHGAEGRPRSLVVELHTNGWNALLLAPDSGRIVDLLSPRRAGERVPRRGAIYEPPASRRLWLDGIPTASEWTAELEGMEPGRRRPGALDRIAFLSTINVDAVLGAWGTGGPPDTLTDAFERYIALRETPPGTASAWILDRRLGPQPYPMSLGEPSATPSPTVMDAMQAAFEAALDRPGDEQPATEPDSEAEALRNRLTRRLSKARRRAGSLGRELDSAADLAGLRETAQLLLARKGQIRRGQALVVVQGFDGADVEIELEPTLGPVENAERLFDEARRRERATARLPALIENALADAKRFETALTDLDASGPSDELWRLAGGRGDAGSGAGTGGEEVRLPYRTLKTTGGLEIRIGRGARANDELTLRHSAPEDIWMHARQAPGAHVILRWGRRDQNPPHADLVEAAIVAALNSDARHSGTVAVDWTRRKYVRKPRKASPGAVIPERVKTLFVEPDPDLPARLVPPT
jgi:hypothetical protein